MEDTPIHQLEATIVHLQPIWPPSLLAFSRIQCIMANRTTIIHRRAQMAKTGTIRITLLLRSKAPIIMQHRTHHPLKSVILIIHIRSPIASPSANHRTTHINPHPICSSNTFVLNHIRTKKHRSNNSSAPLCLISIPIHKSPLLNTVGHSPNRLVSLRICERLLWVLPVFERVQGKARTVRLFDR